MRTKQKPRQIAARFDKLGPSTPQRKAEGLARSIALRIRKGEQPLLGILTGGMP